MSQAVIDALLLLLKDENFNVRFEAGNALGQLGNTSEAVLAVLLPFLKDKNYGVRSNTAYALGQSGNASEGVIDALMPLLKDENSHVRSSVAYALEKLGNASGSTNILNYTAIALDQWIEQNQEFGYVADGVEALWGVMSGETRRMFFVN